MKPIIRPEEAVPEVLPDGWVAEPIGIWAGASSVVLYDARRYDVMMVRGTSRTDLQQTFARSGWEPHAWDGTSTMWLCDRVNVARQRLTEPTPSRAVVVDVPSL